MKKKLLAVLLCVVAVMSVTACKNEEEKATVGKITLGTYKGVEVQKSTNEITDEELQEYIDYLCEYNSYTESVEEGTLEKEMKVKVDYVSTIDGEEYTGGTQTGAVITLKEGSFKVDGVVEALIGKKVGDVVEVDSKYDDDYSDSTLAGKDVHFKVTIKSIQKTVVPEFNDEFAKKYFSYLGYETAAELKEYLREDMRITEVINEIWTGIIDSCVAESYDSVELKELTDSYVEYQEYIIYAYTGYSLDEYLAAMGQTEAEFRAEQEASAKAELKEQMMIEEIIKIENLTLTDEEYQTKLKEYAGNYGYDTVEEFSSAYSSYAKEDFEFSMLYEKVQDVIVANIVLVEDETTTGEDTKYGEDETTTTAE